MFHQRIDIPGLVPALPGSEQLTVAHPFYRYEDECACVCHRVNAYVTAVVHCMPCCVPRPQPRLNHLGDVAQIKYGASLPKTGMLLTTSSPSVNYPPELRAIRQILLGYGWKVGKDRVDSPRASNECHWKFDTLPDTDEEIVLRIRFTPQRLYSVFLIGPADMAAALMYAEHDLQTPNQVLDALRQMIAGVRANSH